MTTPQRIITIAVIVMGTVLTRAIAFIAFPSGRKTPAYVRYLGRVLPAAALGMLVIYCLKDVNLLAGTHGIPELVSLAVVAGLHLWRKNMFLSIAAGTACYMLLVNLL